MHQGDPNGDSNARELVGRLARRLGPRYSPERSSLDTFHVYDRAAQGRVLERLRGIRARIAGYVAEGRGFVWLGAVGTGKDHLMAAMLYAAAAAGLRCDWVNGQDLYGRFRDGMDVKRPEEELLRELVAPEVLGISDPVPPQGVPSGWDLLQLYRVVDRRYHLNRPTWVTMNVLGKKPPEADACELLSAAVWDRLREGAVVLPCFWRSYRGRPVEPTGGGEGT
jgi:DNA replication protein DnaC